MQDTSKAENEKKANLVGFMLKLRLILREAGMELMTLHLTTCPILYTVRGSAPGSNPSSDLLLKVKKNKQYSSSKICKY